MKKTLSLILSAFVLFSALTLTACESGANDGGNESNIQSSEENSDKESSEEEKPDKDSSEEENSDKDSSEEENSDKESSEEENSDKESSEEEKTARDKENDDKDNKDETESEKEAPASDKGKAIAQTARDMLGKPFKWYGASPEEGFDNSGLIYYALKKEGIKAPRMLIDQFNMGVEVSREELREGDIVFFTDEDFFIASIYVGDDTVIYSPSPEKTVRTADLNSVYYNENYLKAVRVS